MSERIRLIIWTPRVLNLGLLTILIFLAAETQQESYAPREQSLNFFFYLSPIILLFLTLLISWKYPLAGGLILCLTALAMLIINFTGSLTPNPLSFPILITGLLYLISYWLSR